MTSRNDAADFYGDLKMVYLWVKWDGEGDWDLHIEFDEKNDENRGTSFMTDCEAEIDDLKTSGHKVKKTKTIAQP